MRKHVISIGSAAALVLAGCGGEQANTQVDSSVITKQEIMETLSRYNVPESIQAELLSKLESGEIWDSLNPNVSPLSVEDHSTAEATISVRRFPDGSITIREIEKPKASAPPGTISPFATIQGCTYRSGSGYSSGYNCTVSENWVVVQGAFTFSYTLVNGGYDYFTGRGTPWFRGAGAFSHINWTIVKMTENASGRARLRVQAQYVAPGGTLSWPVWLGVSIGSNSVTPEHS